MQGAPESTPHELYLRSALASKINAPLKLYADIAGKFIVGRELNGKAESKVHQSTADAQKSKSGGRIVVLDAPPTLTPAATKAKSSALKKRKAAVSAPIAATVRRVPHVVRAKNEGSSAARGQSPPPLPASSQSSPVSPAMRAQMIHLLAKGSRTKEEVLTQVGGSQASGTLRVQLNELLVTVRTLPHLPSLSLLPYHNPQIAERERPSSKTAAPGQPPVYALLPVSWKEVRPYEFHGLTDEERRKMWLQARQALHTLGIPESDAAWDHVRTRPGSTVTGPSKVVVGTKRATGTIGADRKKNIGGPSKVPVEAKDEGVRPVQTTRVREEAVSRPVKTNPKREEDDLAAAPRRLPGASGSKNAARESVPSQPQTHVPSSKKAGPTDARVKRDETSKPGGRPGVITPVQSSSSREREPEREKPTNVSKKQRDHESDLDREKAKNGPIHKVKKRKDVASDMESLRDWDGTDTGKTGLKRKKLREDYDDKDRVPGTGPTVKRRKVAVEDRPYKPGSSSSGISKARERDRDRESDRGHDKAVDRDTLPTAQRPRGSDRDSIEPPPPLPRKLAVRDRESRQRERELDRSVSPPRRVKREPSPTPHSSQQRENSPLPRISIKRADSPSRVSIKREASPPPRLLPRRDDSPVSVRNSKRGASPPRLPAARKRDRDRDRESSVTTRRRRSPIYTSSEDEPRPAAVRRNAPSSVTSSSSSRDVVRTPAFAPHPQPPTAPYPKDREALQARYRKGYRNYIAVYHQWSEERAKIEDALADLGREGSLYGDGDVEMMDEEGLRELADRYAAWTRELEGIRNAYSAVVERMDMAT
jgi:RNA polymerase II elongation factor ELL